MTCSRAASCLLAAGCLALPGCFLSHARDAAHGDPAPDAGTAAPDAASDAASCRPAMAADVACASHGGAPVLAAGVPGTLSIRVDDCHCGGELRCDVRDLAPASPERAGHIELDISVCGEGRCRACTEPHDVSCALPVLSEGVYRIGVGGVETFEIPASARPASDPVSMLCQTRGSAGGGLCAFPGERADTGGAAVCFPREASPGMVSFEVRVPETSCAFEPGPCDAFVHTDRGGRSIVLAPRVRSCDEGTPTWGCSGASGTLTHRCSALLEAGEYRVMLSGGEPLGSLRVAEGAAGAPACAASARGAARGRTEP